MNIDIWRTLPWYIKIIIWFPPFDAVRPSTLEESWHSTFPHLSGSVSRCSVRMALLIPPPHRLTRWVTMVCCPEEGPDNRRSLMHLVVGVSWAWPPESLVTAGKGCVLTIAPSCLYAIDASHYLFPTTLPPTLPSFPSPFLPLLLLFFFLLLLLLPLLFASFLPCLFQMPS